MPNALLTGTAHSNPLYEEVRQQITRGLMSGEWKPGELIPSEIELAKRFGVSKGTVRRALDDLVSERIIIRRQGRGTFVATHTRDRTMYHFFHLIGRDGSKEPPVGELLAYRVVKGSEEACDKLKINTQSRLIYTQILVKVGGEKAFIDDIFIPQAYFPGLTEEIYRGRGTIYELYQSRFNINVVRISEQLSAGHAPEKQARQLGMRVGAPVLLIDRIAYTYQDRPVELRKSWINTDSFVYMNDLRKN